MTGWISLEHHILYNIIRNKPLQLGFTPITNKVKLANGANPCYAYQSANYTLWNRIHQAKSIIQSESSKNLTSYNEQLLAHYKKYLTNFLEPFDGTITIEILASIEMERK